MGAVPETQPTGALRGRGGPRPRSAIGDPAWLYDGLWGDWSHGEDQVLASYYFSIGIGSLRDARPTA